MSLHVRLVSDTRRDAVNPSLKLEDSRFLPPRRNRLIPVQYYLASEETLLRAVPNKTVTSRVALVARDAWRFDVTGVKLSSVS